TDSFETALFTVTSRRLGAVSVINSDSRLVGIITDGDIRRLLAKSASSTVQAVYAMKVKDVMTPSPKYIHYNRLATEALRMMEDHKITVLPVVDDMQSPIGMVHIHDLVTAGIGESTRVTQQIRKE
ncbi:MAG: CBS domain-containing protein, partial [bacterium]